MEEEKIQSNIDPKVVNKKNILIIILLSIIVVGLIGMGSFFFYQHHKQAIAEQKAAQKAKALKLKKELLLSKELAKYKKDINETLVNIDILTTNAQNVNSAYSQVWHDAIFNSDFQINGEDYFSSDYNDAISLEKKYLEDNGDISIIDSTMKEVDSEVQSLNNPPKKYTSAFDALSTLYNDVKKYVNLADSPSGSLLSFNQDITQLQSNIQSEMADVKVKLPQASGSKKALTSKPKNDTKSNSNNKTKTNNTTENATLSPSNNSQSDIEQDVKSLKSKVDTDQWEPIIKSQPDAKVSDGNGGTLYAWNVILNGNGDGSTQQIYFFDNNQYLGTDTSEPHMTSSVNSGSTGTIIATYQHYLVNDPMSNPTGKPFIVSFYWNGNSLKPNSVSTLDDAVNDQFK